MSTTTSPSRGLNHEVRVRPGCLRTSSTNCRACRLIARGFPAAPGKALPGRPPCFCKGRPATLISCPSNGAETAPLKASNDVRGPPLATFGPPFEKILPPTLRPTRASGRRPGTGSTSPFTLEPDQDWPVADVVYDGVQRASTTLQDGALTVMVYGDPRSAPRIPIDDAMASLEQAKQQLQETLGEAAPGQP